AVFSSVFLISTFVFLLSSILFFRHLRRVGFPFIQPKFIFGKGFGAVNIVTMIYSGLVMGGTSLIPLYAVNRYGIRDIHSWTLLVANGIASVILSTVMSVYIQRTGYRMPLYVGAVILVIGVALLAVAPPLGISPLYWLIGSTFILGI